MKKNIVEGLQIWLSKSTDVYFREKKKNETGRRMYTYTFN